MNTTYTLAIGFAGRVSLLTPLSRLFARCALSIALLAPMGLSTTCWCSEIRASAQQLSDRSDLIFVALVTKTQAKQVNGQRGNHIYTDVTLRPKELVKGQLPDGEVVLEVVGGTLDGITELVSFSPTFEEGEEAVLFLKVNPLKLVGARQGKRPIRDGKFVIDGFSLTPRSFAIALERWSLNRRSGAKLEQALSEVGERIGPPRAGPSPAERSAKSVVQPAKEAPGSVGPKDAGGGQLPSDEIPKGAKGSSPGPQPSGAKSQPETG